jgi:hypothetical protein
MQIKHYFLNNWHVNGKRFCGKLFFASCVTYRGTQVAWVILNRDIANAMLHRVHGENFVGRNKNFVQRNFCCVGRFRKILQRFNFFVGVFR